LKKKMPFLLAWKRMVPEQPLAENINKKENWKKALRASQTCLNLLLMSQTKRHFRAKHSREQAQLLSACLGFIPHISPTKNSIGTDVTQVGSGVWILHQWQILLSMWELAMQMP
jgi:hypothetical protein